MKSIYLSVAFALTLSSASAFAATVVVTNTNSSGPGSLAQAITDANADSAQDRIAFNIPGGGVHKIDVTANPLPEITNPVLIDGYTQPGAHANTRAVGDDAVILIQVDGGSGTRVPIDGFVIRGGQTLIRGISVTGFRPYGIYLVGLAGGNVVDGCFIGLEPSGAPVGSTYGIYVSGPPQTTIGGNTPASRNIISGNEAYGLFLATNPPLTIAGNYIGTDPSGMMAVGNDTGIYGINVYAKNDVVIGGSGQGAGNLISGNRLAIQLGEQVPTPIGSGSLPCTGIVIAGNSIGTASDNRTALGNGAGIFLLNSSSIIIGGTNPSFGNIIAFNREAGVEIYGYPAVNNSILSN